MKNKVVRCVESLVVEKQDDGGVVFDEARGIVHVLNSTALTVLEMCTEDTVEDVIGNFIRLIDFSETDITEAEIESDVMAIISSMLSKELLVHA